MNTTQLSPTDREMDQMLSGFFKSELPNPFPPLNLPTRAELPMPLVAGEPTRERRTNTLKSKLSIAVSVALLIGGCWYLSGRMSEKGPEQAKIGKGADGANVPKEIKKAMP